MSTKVQPSVAKEIDYPDSDGKPMAETPEHRDNLAWLVEMLRFWFALEAMVYVSGNMFIYYVRGNRRKHVSPDVFVTRGIPKNQTPTRRRYLVWEENKAPDLVIELTSKSTRKEDMQTKFQLYQDVLKVQEYFLFDPYKEYLRPQLQGFRLVDGKYRRITTVDGRLPSEVLGLHLEADGWMLRLYDPKTRQWLPIPPEEREGRQKAEAAQKKAEAEAERLRQELAALRKRIRE